MPTFRKEIKKITVKIKYLTVDEQLNLLEKYHLTPTELFTIQTILLAKDEDTEYLFRFAGILTHCGGSIRDVLISLQNKGIILKSYKIPNKGETFIVEDIQLNKNFTKTFYKSAFVLGKELFDTYPTTTIVNGDIYKLRRISKKFNSFEDAFRVYGKSIKWNPKTHQEVINLVKWGIENGYNFTTLDSFIVDNDWLNIKSIKENNGINVNFNAIKMI